MNLINRSIIINSKIIILFNFLFIKFIEYLVYYLEICIIIIIIIMEFLININEIKIINILMIKIRYWIGIVNHYYR